MLKRKKGILAAGLICGMLVVTGCSEQGKQIGETPYFSMLIDGGKEYRAEENLDVQQLKELTLGYIELTCNIDYRNTENAMDELNYYTESTKKEYIEYEYVQGGIETMEYYEQIMELLETSVEEIQFYQLNDKEKARVACDYITVIPHATDEYFEELGIKKDTKYKRTMMLGFVREEGEWKIDEYDITDRIEVK